MGHTFKNHQTASQDIPQLENNKVKRKEADKGICGTENWKQTSRQSVAFGKNWKGEPRTELLGDHWSVVCVPRGVMGLSK